MALFDDASLVTTPNGYKAGTLYSIKPTSGAGDMTVVRATTATRVNSAGLIESVANNVPRLDYSNGTCPSLLVEPQRTNLTLYSEQFDNAYWTKYLTSITSNVATAPNGTTTADLFTSTGSGYTYSSFISLSAASYTISVYAKKGNTNWSAITISNGITTDCTSWYNINSGTLGSTSGSITITNRTIEDAGNGWYRLTLTISLASADSFIVIPQFVQANSGASTNGDTGYAWGAQLEVGSYPTSYIPTTSAAVTRNADVISKTGISSLIGQTEGAVFVDINVDLSYTQNDMRFINVSDGTSTNWWFIGTNVSNQIRFYYRTGATTYVSELVALTSGRHKLAFAYKSNDYVAYVDGTQIYSLNSLIVGATSQIDLGNSFGGSGVSKQFINSAIIFPTRLTNAELASLTTI